MRNGQSTNDRLIVCRLQMLCLKVIVPMTLDIYQNAFHLSKTRGLCWFKNIADGALRAEFVKIPHPMGHWLRSSSERVVGFANATHAVKGRRKQRNNLRRLANQQIFGAYARSIKNTRFGYAGPIPNTFRLRGHRRMRHGSIPFPKRKCMQSKSPTGGLELGMTERGWLLAPSSPGAGGP